eukprot:SAG31_NODE_18384_length_638_cov_1.111317_2_plen_105_part_00
MYRYTMRTVALARALNSFQVPEVPGNNRSKFRILLLVVRTCRYLTKFRYRSRAGEQIRKRNTGYPDTTSKFKFSTSAEYRSKFSFRSFVLRGSNTKTVDEGRGY